jgi:hypothetical protein
VLVVLLVDRDGSGVLGERGDLVERLGHGSIGAGRQLLHH